MDIYGSTLDNSSKDDDNTSDFDGPFAAKEVCKIRSQDQTCPRNIRRLMKTELQLATTY